MKIAILQKYNKKVESLADITGINKIWYAEKHGYDFINDTTEYMYESNRSDTWLIQLSVLNTIRTRPDIDWIFWTDVDSIIADMSVKLENIISLANNNEHIIANMWPLPSPFTLKNLQSPHIEILNQPSTWFMFHTGNWLIRNCEWSYNFLNMVYRDTRFINIKELRDHPTGDEVGMTIYYMGYPEYRKHIKIIPGSLFLSIPQGTENLRGIMKPYDRNDFILHVPFQPLDIKEYKLGNFMRLIYG